MQQYECKLRQNQIYLSFFETPPYIFNSGKLVATSSCRKTYKESVFALSTSRNFGKNFFHRWISSVKNAFACLYLSPVGGSSISAWRGGTVYFCGRHAESLVKNKPDKSPRYLFIITINELHLNSGDQRGEKIYYYGI